MAYSIQTGFRDALSPTTGELAHFHERTVTVAFLIGTLVLHIITLTLTTKHTHKH